MPVKNLTRSASPWLLAIGVATGLWLLCFAAILVSATPAQADGKILLVPDQYATIQAAISAAADGDEIRVVGGNFTNDPGGVLARTCDGGASWKWQVWAEFDPIRIVAMAPVAP